MAHEAQSLNRAREQARKQARDLSGFDYAAPAELFPTRSKFVRGPVAYRRFASAAEAVRFAVEELSAAALNGAYLEVDEARFGRDEIRQLYDNAAFPLKRAG